MPLPPPRFCRRTGGQNLHMGASTSTVFISRYSPHRPLNILFRPYPSQKGVYTEKEYYYTYEEQALA